MREDVLRKIMELCENEVRQIKRDPCLVPVTASALGTLILVIGMCGGAILMDETKTNSRGRG
jgi:hypothetical protein